MNDGQRSIGGRFARRSQIDGVADCGGDRALDLDQLSHDPGLAGALRPVTTSRDIRALPRSTLVLC